MKVFEGPLSAVVVSGPLPTEGRRLGDEWRTLVGYLCLGTAQNPDGRDGDCCPP